jgi:uncharacterized phage-like protein YoqJ
MTIEGLIMNFKRWIFIRGELGILDWVAHFPQM